MPKPLTQEQFIATSKQVHGDIYDYSAVEYVNFRTPVTIICLTHGPWQVRPHLHTSNKTKCPQCAILARSNDPSSFFDRCKRVHPTLDFSAATYHGIKRTVTNVVCERHGPFRKRASDLVAGSGCPICAKKHNGQFKWSNFFVTNPSKREAPAEVYLYRFKHTRSGHVFYKVGITTVGCKKRFRGYMEFEKEQLGCINTTLLDAVSIERAIQSQLVGFETKFTLFPRAFYGKSECYDISSDEVARIQDQWFS